MLIIKAEDDTGISAWCPAAASSPGTGLSRRSCVIVKQPTEPLMPTHATNTSFRRLTLNQFVAQSLMIPFAMTLGDELRDGPPSMALAERNQPIGSLHSNPDRRSA